MIEIKAYTPALSSIWNRAVENSRNGTFLLSRPYMDYHAGRFTDLSLMIYVDGEPEALLPAAVAAGADTDTVVSHPGLTYGGLIMSPHLCAPAVVDIIEAIREYYAAASYRHLIYTPAPHIYQRQPSDDDLYGIWRHGARLHRVNLSSAFRLGDRPRPDTNTVRNLRKGLANGIECRCGTLADITGFHALLSLCLADRHGAAPVHSATEMLTLMKAFPDNIRLYLASDGADTVAGVLVYITHTVTHTQYIATSEKGRALRALPVLFEHIIGECRTVWFDFGTSNEDGGRILNAGLMRQKRGEGGRPVAYPSYIIDL